jgi:hypothetical protein
MPIWVREIIGGPEIECKLSYLFMAAITACTEDAELVAAMDGWEQPLTVFKVPYAHQTALTNKLGEELFVVVVCCNARSNYEPDSPVGREVPA